MGKKCNALPDASPQRAVSGLRYIMPNMRNIDKPTMTPIMAKAKRTFICLAVGGSRNGIGIVAEIKWQSQENELISTSQATRQDCYNDKRVS